MPVAVEHACPQCGAPVTFAETERLVRCSYCGVRNFLVTDHYLRTLFSPRVAGESLIFAPYLHFKGNVYFARERSIAYKHVHITPLGADSAVLPATLGWRTQTHKLKLLAPVPGATFLRFSRRPGQLLQEALAGSIPAGTPVHFIGETLNLVYFPLVRTGEVLRDGLTGDLVARLPASSALEAHALEHPPRPSLRFVATLCPQCGADLHGEGQSVVLTCTGCDTAWEADQGTLVPRAVQTVHTRGGTYVYLPFWRMIIVSTREPHFDTRATFTRLTGQRVLDTGTTVHADMDSARGAAIADPAMVFYAPAFKIHPRAFLRLAARLSLAQPTFPARPDVPRAHHHPVTLPAREARETIPLIVGELAFNKQHVLPLMHRLHAEVQAPSLIYLPFRLLGAQLVEPHLNLAIEPRALDFARFL